MFKEKHIVCAAIFVGAGLYVKVEHNGMCERLCISLCSARHSMGSH